MARSAGVGYRPGPDFGDGAMKSVLCVVAFMLAVSAGPVVAGPASGMVKSKTGAITPKHAVAYVVRDGRNARNTRVELLLTDVAVDAERLRGELDPHVIAINLEELRDRNYLLLWVAADGTVTMNATYSKTMTQYLNDTAGGLTATFTTNSATRVEGRVWSEAPLKSMDGDTYSIDVRFTADVMPALTGTALPAGGGEPGKALTAFLGAVRKKQWPVIKAGLSAKALPMFDKDYNSPAENAESAADLFTAWLPMDKLRVGVGQLVTPTVAVLEVEGERFGSPWMSLVRMVNTAGVWQYDQSAQAGSLR